MTSLNLPSQAYVNKFVAKSKFYERAHIGSKLQKEFIEKIQRITWRYKLAQETIGIPKAKKVTEIQIFELELKSQHIPKNVLKVIDKAIPYQILYKFTYNDATAWAITLKEGNRPENYYFSEWNEQIAFTFTGLDLESVYKKLVRAFIDTDTDKSTDFDQLVAHDSIRKQLEQQISALDRKIKNEKQFNRKVELNKQLLANKNKLKTL